MYRGPDHMKLQGHGFQLFHGEHYLVEVKSFSTGRILVSVSDTQGTYSTTGTYPDEDRFDVDWVSREEEDEWLRVITDSPT